MSPMIRQPLTVELALLGFLREGPLHGYEIHRRLSDPAGLGEVWRLKQSHLYALLTRLAEEGYLTSTLESQETRPNRRRYRLTRVGRSTFRAWVRAPVSRGRDIRLDFLTRYFFAEREGRAVAERLIQAQRTICQDWLRQQQRQAESAREARPFEWKVCQFRLGQIEAMLTWLDVCAEAQSNVPEPDPTV
jgi:PadR family transcriptional regulator AphA